jgi:hypothetical protein
MRSVTSTGTNLPLESTGGFRTEQREKLLLYRTQRERGHLTNQNPHGLHLDVGSDGDQNPQGSQLVTGWERASCARRTGNTGGGGERTSVDEESLSAGERPAGSQSGARVGGFGDLGFLLAAESFVWGE